MVKISVIMGAYNCEETLEEALTSLFEQTFSDFEVIICDDGSTDNTLKILTDYQKKYPEKFIILVNKVNKGLNFTLNKCLDSATGKYIARMDADDISVPDRLELQNSFLDLNPEYSFVSSAMIYFDSHGEWGRSKPIPRPLKEDLVRNSPFAHAATMFRKEALDQVNGYTESKKLLRVEDYHLWIKLYSLGLQGYNLKLPLYKMRDDQNAFRRRTYQNRINEAYVRLIAIKEFDLPIWNILYVLRPLIVGLLPKKIYMFLHKKRLENNI